MSPWSVTGNGINQANTGRSTVNPRTGKYSLQAQGNGGIIPTPYTVTLSQNVKVVPGKTYNLAFSTKQNVPSCFLSSTFNNVPVVNSIRPADSNYATTTAVIPAVSTTSGTGTLSITATGCLGTSIWFDDISLTPA